MAIRERIAISFRVTCDGCDCWGPLRLSEEDARWAAKRSGFKTVTGGGIMMVAEDLCPICYKERSDADAC